MTKKLYIVAALAVGLVAWGCQKDNGGTGDTTPKAPTAITLSTSTIEAERTGGDFSVTVTAPTKPSVSAKPDWVTVQDGTYNKDTYKVTLTLKVAAYGEYGSREGQVTIASGSLSQSLKITQKGRETPVVVNTDIDTELVTSGATAGAQDLYDYLLSQYGKRTVSAVMANVNWNNTVASAVYQNTGKYPAMNCYDFIHILYSGQGWINYEDITPVTNWASAGGIVSLMWHFNVPKTAAAPGPVEDVTCSPSLTSFKASNVMVDGSWEQVWFDYYVDKVAGVILKLQEAGIAAIWRPFHEAAGNYYALKWNGAAWFWWGADGPEVYKQLWNRLQDAFYAKGIRNLIWVWTAQSYNGDSASYDSDEAYYPGDDRVDVVGRDLYGPGADACALEFVQLQNTYNHKMISLAECGWNGSSANPIASIPDQWTAGAQWSWFMAWCDNNGYTMVDTAWWQAALDSEYVITREDVNY